MLQNPHHYPWRHAPARVERTRSGGILPMGRIPSEALRRKHASTMTDDASARHRQPHRRRDRASATDTSPDDAGTGPRTTRCGATFQANREGQPVLKLVVSSYGHVHPTHPVRAPQHRPPPIARIPAVTGTRIGVGAADHSWKRSLRSTPGGNRFFDAHIECRFTVGVKDE